MTESLEVSATGIGRFGIIAGIGACSRRIDTPELRAIEGKFRPHGIGYLKYFDLPRTVEFNLNRALRLNLPSRRPVSLLDLGCGFGVFPYIAKQFGHRAIGLDYDDPTDLNTVLFREVYHHLNKVERLSHKIVAFEPLPFASEQFDIITAFQICFTNFNKPNAWSVPEWTFMLSQLRSLLTSNGEVVLHFSKPEGSDLFRPPGVDALFARANAAVDGPYVSLTKRKLDAADLRMSATQLEVTVERSE